jgi:CheY-like chemotaxis protein
VLLASGYSLNQRANQILARGCDGFLQKPFDLPLLSQKLRGMLDSEDISQGFREN